MRRAIPLVASFLAATIASGQAEVSPSPPAPDPVCELAFQLASASGPTSSASPSPDPVLVDSSIRACADLAAWMAAASRHPGVLAGAEGLARLAERCQDPGLAPLPVCRGLTAIASPAPASPAPTPSVSAPSTPGPAATPSSAPGDEATTHRLVRLPRFPSRVRGAARVRTFTIRGSSPDELLRQMQERSAGFCPQHAAACTQTQPRIRPRVETNPLTGSCRVVDVMAAERSTVFLPRWSGPRRVYPELVAWWRVVNAHIAWHEARHIDIARRHLRLLRRRLIGTPCQRISQELQRLGQELGEAQAAWDRRDRDWLPRYEGPLP